MKFAMESARILAILVFFPGVTLAAGNSQGDSAFDVLTDLAPLLALFGEQFARQFLSESLTWWDHLIFAMLPLGIVTAIIGAIRVSGPSWARAFIGRAKETRATAEIELMSSTSTEVCEVFNGRGIVRAIGIPKLFQFILLPKPYRHDDSCGIYTLERALNYQPPILVEDRFNAQMNCESGTHPGNPAQTECSGTRVDDDQESSRTDRPQRSLPWKRLSNIVADIEEGRESHIRATGFENMQQCNTSDTHSSPQGQDHPAFPEELRNSAPNIQLNLPVSASSHDTLISELKKAAACAILLQSGVIVVSVVTTFYRKAKVDVGEPKSPAGLGLFICGTVSLSLGMMLCSWVIERSTREYAWHVAPQSARPDVECKQSPSVKLSSKSLQKISNMVPGAKRNTEDEDNGFELFWLQQKHTVNDQEFDPFLIVGGLKRVLLTSSRIEHPTWSVHKKVARFANNIYELLSVIAALLGVSGFVLQFEGLRNLSWPTAVAQLLGIILVAAIRAFVRRRLGERPPTLRSLAGHELDWLALRLAYEEKPLQPPPHYEDIESPNNQLSWSIVTQADLFRTQYGTPKNQEFPKDNNEGAAGLNVNQGEVSTRLLAKAGKFTSGDVASDGDTNTSGAMHSCKQLESDFRAFPSNSQTAMRVRRRLGELTGCPGTASREAVALSQAIVLVLNEFFPMTGHTTSRTFSWYVDTVVSDIYQEEGPLPDAGVQKGEARSKSRANSHEDSSETDQQHEPGFDTITLRAVGNESGWRVDTPDIDAVLSLWLSSFAKANARSSTQSTRSSTGRFSETKDLTVKYRRILGENHSLKSSTRPNNNDEPVKKSAKIRTDALTRDLAWWTNDLRIAELSNSAKKDKTVDQKYLGTPPGYDDELVIEYSGLADSAGKALYIPEEGAVSPLEPPPEVGTPSLSRMDWAKGQLRESGSFKTVYIHSSSSLVNALVQHLFSSFMWAVSALIANDSLQHGNTVEDSELFDWADFENTWALPTLRNTKIMGIARSVQSFGLGTLEDILLGMIPPFSFRGILPNEGMVAVILKKSKEFESTHDWLKVRDAYLNLFKIDLDPRCTDHTACEIAVEIIEFLLLAQDVMHDVRCGAFRCMKRGTIQASSLGTALDTIKEDLAKHDILRIAAQDLLPYLVFQKRDRTWNTLFSDLADLKSLPTIIHSRNAYSDGIVKFTWFHKFCTDKNDGVLYQGSCNKQHFLVPDNFGWSPLHYAAVNDSCKKIENALKLTNTQIPYHEPRDRSGKIPLHYAAQHCPALAWKLLLDSHTAKLTLKVKGRDGKLLMHHGAKTTGIYDFLPPGLERVDPLLPDKFGRTALHVAAVHGNLEAVWSLLVKHEKTLTQSGEELLKMNPLHLAVLHAPERYPERISFPVLDTDESLTALSVANTENDTPIDFMFKRIDHGQLETILIALETSTVHTVVMERAIQHNCLKALEAIFKSAKIGSREGKEIFEAFSMAHSQDKFGLLTAMFKLAKNPEPTPGPNVVLTQFKTLSPAFGNTAIKQFQSSAKIEYGLSQPGAITSIRDVPDLSKTKFPGSDQLCEGSRARSRPAKYDITRPGSLRAYVRSQLRIGVSGVLISAIRNADDNFISDFLELGLTEKNPNYSDWNKKDENGLSVITWIARADEHNFKILPTIEFREKILEFLWCRWSPEERALALNEPQGEHNMTPLMYAAQHGLPRIVEIFTKNGARVQGLDKHLRTACYFAIRQENYRVDMLKAMITSDPDAVNERSLARQETLLMYAIGYKLKRLLEFLHTCERIDPNASDIDGNTAILLAGEWSRKEPWKSWLFELFPSIDPQITNRWSSSALGLSYANIRYSYLTSSERYRRLRERQYREFHSTISHSTIELYGYQVMLILTDTIRCSLDDFTKAIFDLGFDACSLDSAGRSIIFLAALKNCTIFKTLWGRIDNTGRSEKQLEQVFHACAQHLSQDSKRIVSDLLTSGINSNVRDKSNWSALECARRAGNSAIEEILEANEADDRRGIIEHRSPSRWALRDDDPSFRNISDLNQSSDTILNYRSPFHIDTPVLIRTDHCIPYNLQRYHWDFTVLKPKGSYSEREIAFGICTENLDHVPLPGFEGVANSGAILRSSDTLARIPEDQPTMAIFEVGHMVGCLVHLVNRELVFSFDNGSTGILKLSKKHYAQVYTCLAIWPNKTTEPGPLVRAHFGPRQRRLSWTEEATLSTPRRRNST